MLAYLWGRVSQLAPGIEHLSAGRVVPQPLSLGVCASLAVGVVVLFLLLEGLLYWVAKKQGGQRSSLRAHLYTGLLIEAPLYALLIAITLVLLYRPDLGSSARLLFAAVAGALLLYSLLLHVFAVMAVHRVGAGKAMLCVALTVVALAAVLVALLAAGENEGSRSGSSSHAGGGDQRGVWPGDGSDSDMWGRSYQQGGGGSDRQASARASLLHCPTCGLWLPEGIGQPGMSCPRCGAPMRYR